MKNAIWLILTEKQQKYQRYHPEKNDKYEYLTGFFILPSNQRQGIEQDEFTYSPLGKAFENQISKSNWRTRKKTNQKQLKSFRSFKIRGKKRKYKINWRNFAKRSEN